MKQFLRSTVFITGLVIFTMLFGAANLFYPIKAGLNSGDKFLWGIVAFLFTAVVIPVIGLIGIILFDGDYDKFFGRLGIIPGKTSVGICMAIIGPLIVMPRIVGTSYNAILPFMPLEPSIFIFGLVFCALTFAATLRESKVLKLLGDIIGPVLLGSLVFIIAKGLWTASSFTPIDTPTSTVILDQALLGYKHLDLLGMIFFGSIVLNLLKKSANDTDLKKLALIGMQAGAVACCFLTVIYGGLALLGALHGAGLEAAPVGNLFNLMSLRIMGENASLVIAIVVISACFSTLMALAMVLAEYLQNEVSHRKLNYPVSLAIILLLTAILTSVGINSILLFSGPIIDTFYPVVMAVTFLNVAYKLFDFKPIKLPVLAVLLVSIYCNWSSYAIYSTLFN